MKTSAMAVIALVLVALVAWMLLLWVYSPVGLFWYTIALYVIAIILLLNIRRISKRRKQASVIPST